MKEIDYKTLEGHSVFVLPTGNSVDRASSYLDQPNEALVVSSTKVFVTLHIQGFDNKFRINCNKNFLVSDNSNNGYMVFATKQELTDYIKGMKTKEKLISDVLHARDADIIPLLVKIHDALGWDLVNDKNLDRKKVT